ncbi:hypothetical protein OBP_293 [Pseudomonas phage OBP]|uniref:hypothetical protein n=1 Tax=Pseudomonas phage OBP TaxID=1124849 RepID=UPI000240D640|nr:hypothetical protein OBP_293 [Pseudomonas phage OBP]AEV89730.1 hypothetical protein OBP_293 [Pseudomonas phage OBP]
MIKYQFIVNKDNTVTIDNLLDSMNPKAIGIVTLAGETEVVKSLKERLIAFNPSMKIVMGVATRDESHMVKVFHGTKVPGMSREDIVGSDIVFYVNELDQIRAFRSPPQLPTGVRFTL